MIYDNHPFPIQGSYHEVASNIPWWLAELAYESYVRCYGNRQTLERLAERGGFGRGELVNLIRREWE